MREADIIAPPTDCLAPITDELVEAGLKKEFDADFYAASTRDASVHGGDPFIVEAGPYYGGDVEAENKATVMRFANRVPLVYQRGAAVRRRTSSNRSTGATTGWTSPAAAVFRTARSSSWSTSRRRTSPSRASPKDAVANVPEMESEIELAIREAARDLKSYLNKRRSMQQRREKQNKLATILPEMAEKLTEVTGKDELVIDDSIARIANNVPRRPGSRGRYGQSRRRENNSDTNADVDVTDIVSVEPQDTNGAQVVEMDGEWFVKWSETVSSGRRRS